jgi:hypothetical protein
VNSLASPEPVTAQNPYSPALRLLAIPLLVYLAWVLETFLLAGNPRLMEHPDPAGFAVYTVVGCILTGMIVPVICIMKGFASGAVTMFQAGFGSARRTVLFCSLTLLAGCAIVAVANPFGPDRLAFFRAFLLLLPTGAASVMVCWALAGTHIQAFVRGGGTILPITTGVVVTGILFAASTLAVNPSARQEGALFWPVCIGAGAALFFFAIRDVHATTVALTGALVFSQEAVPDPAVLHTIPPEIFLIALLAAAVPAGLHAYLARNYTTVIVMARP